MGYATPSLDPFRLGFLSFVVAALLFLVTAVAAQAVVPADGVARERFDMLEQNAFYDDQGRLVFDQLLFWDWSHDAGRFQLQAWRMLKWQSGTKENGPISTMLPRFEHAKNVWVVEWLDGDVHRRIESPVFRQSVTQFDPELEERVYLPKEKRRELLRVKK